MVVVADVMHVVSIVITLHLSPRTSFRVRLRPFADMQLLIIGLT